MQSIKKTPNQKEVNPLYVIFEQHLCNFQDSNTDRKTFILNVVQDYLTYLRKKNISVPKVWERAVIEELGDQVNTMLVKKIYGFLNIQDYQNDVPFEAKRKAKVRYSKLRSRSS